MAATAILDFQVMWIWPLRRVDSVVFVLCTKFGSNICYSHWDRRTYPSEIHLMTSRELTSGFDFWSRGHSAWPAHDTSAYNISLQIFLSSPELLILFRNQDGGIFRLCEFGYYGVLIVWYLCSVPNLVQIYVIVTEIDALMLLTFIRWRHAN